MGIPSYFAKIIRDYPNLLKYQEYRVIKNIFLDFNCCIHGCSNELKSQLSAEGRQTSTKEFETMLIKRVINYIDFIYDYVKPQKTFGIAIDGVPPFAKVIQQRNRRYLNMWKRNRILQELSENERKNHKQISKIKSEWNSSAISPETHFMNVLYKNIEKHLATNSRYSNIDIILSGSQEHGEGEHKIFNEFIKEGSREGDTIIYGLDADLIMLSLLHVREDSNIFLMREPIHMPVKLLKEEPFIFLDIAEYKDTIKLFYNSFFKDNMRIIENYVALCFLLGNDFIPHLSYISIKNDGIEELLGEYQVIMQELSEDLLVWNADEKVWKWNIYFLKLLIENLAKGEDEKYAKISHKFYKMKYMPRRDISRPPPDYIERIKTQWENYPIIHKLDDKIKIGEKGWRQRYYYYLFKTTDGAVINDICNNYLESLQFTLDYYMNFVKFQQVPVYKVWYYKYNYSPTLYDLSNYMLEINEKAGVKFMNYQSDFLEIMERENLDAISCEMQQMIIFPFDSLNLINNHKHRDMCKNKNSGIRHYYPNDFNILTYMKMATWQCYPNIPQIDLAYLSQIL